MSAGCNRIFIPVDDQPNSDFLAEPVAKFNHLFELVTRVDMKKGKRQPSWIKRLTGEVYEYARVLADGIQQYGITELRDSFAEDINGFAFKFAKMCPVLIHDLTSACLCNPHSFELVSHHQRPERMSSPGRTARVQGAHPILG